MRALLLGLGLLLAASPASAAEDWMREIRTREVCRNAEADPGDARLCGIGRSLRARRVKHVGVGITAVGSVPVLTGLALMAAAAISDAQPCRDELCEGTGPLAVIGLLVAAVGVPPLAVGVPMWVGGHRREQALKADLGLTIAQRRPRLELTFRF